MNYFDYFNIIVGTIWIVLLIPIIIGITIIIFIIWKIKQIDDKPKESFIKEDESPGTSPRETVTEINDSARDSSNTRPSSSVMFCPNCGYRINKDDAFCTSCGKHLR